MDEPVEKSSITSESDASKSHTAVPPVAAESAQRKRADRPQSRAWIKAVGIIVLCVTTSAATAWVLLGTGVIRPDTAQTIDANREKIVLQQGEIVADVFKKVSPSTVAITTESVSETRRYFGTGSVEQGAGSGIIISSDGYILTNKHVVPSGNSARLTVVLADGTAYSDVTVVGRDPLNDIAFLKINGAKDLPAVDLGNSDDVQPGQQVVAIGNALGEFRNSVTSGIISGKGRPIQASDGSGASEQLENLLQTDAAINPGNSGGPLVTLDGKVVGINTAISEEGQAVGFAIPINDAKGLIGTVLKQGKIVRPYLGVRYVNLDKTTAERFELDVTKGAYVIGNAGAQAVAPRGPAEKAGIKSGDIITKVDTVEINEEHSLASALAPFTPGTKVTLTYIRDGKTQTTSVTLEPYPGS